MKICFVFDDLLGGGAARVAALLGNAFAEKGWSVVLMTTDDGKQPSVYNIGEGVQHLPLALRRDSRSFISGMFMNLHRIGNLSRALRRVQPDLVISFLDGTNVLVLLSTCFSGIPVIISERNDPAFCKIGWQWEPLRRLTYPWADALVCQGQRPLSYFPSSIRKRSYIIPNPVSLPQEHNNLRAELHRPGRERRIVAMGRLQPQKGFDLLLQAFAIALKRYPHWTLSIWGEGPERTSLEEQVNALGIKPYVELPGLTHEPYRQLAAADIFVLSSRFEGFPNVLTEAMALGLPVIATDVGAVPEIIRDGVDGVLVPPGQVDSLAVAMDRLMGDHEARKCMAARAPEVLERFSLNKVIGMWEELIHQVI